MIKLMGIRANKQIEEIVFEWVNERARMYNFLFNHDDVIRHSKSNFLSLICRRMEAIFLKQIMSIEEN